MKPRPGCRRLNDTTIAVSRRPRDAPSRCSDPHMTIAAAGTEIARSGAGPRFDPRTRMLLEASIPGTLLRLAAPNVLVMLVQAAVGLIETYFVGKLGTDALAGVTLVFPVLMLMPMIPAGPLAARLSSPLAPPPRP